MPVGRHAPPALAAERPGRELWADLHERLRRLRRAGAIGDPHAADDVAQEVLLRLSPQPRRAARRRSTRRVRLPHRAQRDHRPLPLDRQRQELPSPPDDLVERIDADGGTDDEPDAVAGPQELARCLAPLIRRLPDRYREALTLTDLGELSQVEAAEVVGSPSPA